MKTRVWIEWFFFSLMLYFYCLAVKMVMGKRLNSHGSLSLGQAHLADASEAADSFFTSEKKKEGDRRNENSIPADYDDLSDDSVMMPKVTPDIILRKPREEDFYHTYDQMITFLNLMHDRFPDITKVSSIGTSVEGRDLIVFVIDVKKNDPDLSLRPNVNYIGGIHGDEAVGKEMLLYLIWYLLHAYGKNGYPDVNKLLNNAIIHILPMMNPDGMEKSEDGACRGGSGRKNANGVDLNRDFPNLADTSADSSHPSQPETVAVVEWTKRNQFVISGDIHAGSVVAIIPPNTERRPLMEKIMGLSARGPKDLTVFYKIAHGFMDNKARQHPCKKTDPTKPVEIGSVWYEIENSMQDFYEDVGTLQVTLEINCCKKSDSNKLADVWLDNRKALIKFLMQANLGGIRGFVQDSEKRLLGDATINIVQGGITFKAEGGRFWRMLVNGIYDIDVSADGYYPASITVSVNDDPIELTIILEKKPLDSVNTDILAEQEIIPEDTQIIQSSIEQETTPEGTSIKSKTIVAIPESNLAPLLSVLSPVREAQEQVSEAGRKEVKLMGSELKSIVDDIIHTSSYDDDRKPRQPALITEEQHFDDNDDQPLLSESMIDSDFGDEELSALMTDPDSDDRLPHISTFIDSASDTA